MKKSVLKCMSLLLAGMLAVLSTSAAMEAAGKKIIRVETKLNLKVGESRKIAVKNKKGHTVTWKSNKKAIVSVSKAGNIKAKKPGTANVTAVIKPKGKGASYQLTYKVTVKKTAETDKTPDATMPAATQPSTAAPSAETPQPTGTQGVVSTATPVPYVEPASPEAVNVLETNVSTGRAIEGMAYVYEENRNRFGNQVVADYETMQQIIDDEKEWGRVSGGFIRSMEQYDRAFFEDKSLIIGSYGLTCGYDVSVRSVVETDRGDSTKLLQCNIDAVWFAGEDNVQTNVVCHTFLIEVPAGCVSSGDQVVVQPAFFGRHLSSHEK